MKKKIFFLPLLAIAIAACDTSIEDSGHPSPAITAAELQNRVTLTQTGTENAFTYSTSPALPVQVLDQDGNILASGVAGELKSFPPPVTSLIVRVINQDGTFTSIEKNVTITEYKDVPEIYRVLYGTDYSERTWTWDDTDPNGVWGNGNLNDHDGPAWWKVSAADIDSQATSKNLPQDGINGWMKFICKQRIVKTSRGQDGSTSWDGTKHTPKSTGDFGQLTFKGTFPLMGILVNKGNKPQYEYWILKMDNTHITLAAAESKDEPWGTAFFWNFKVKTN